MTILNPNTVQNLVLAAQLALATHTQSLKLGEPISLAGDFTLYAVADTVEGANWAAFGGEKKLTIGARNGELFFTLAVSALTGTVSFGGGQLITGRTLLRVSRIGGVVEIRATGGNVLQAEIGVQLGKIDLLGVSTLPLANSDPAIRQLFNAVILRAITFDSPEDVAIRALIEGHLGAVL